MNEKVEAYVKQIERQICEEKKKEKDKFLIEQGFWVEDLSYPNGQKPLDISDEDYELMKTAHNKYNSISAKSENEEYLFSTMKMSPADKDSVNAGDVMRYIADIVSFILLGLAIGCREFFLDEYDPEFDVAGMIVYLVIAITIFICTMSLAQTIKETKWCIFTRKDKKQR